jgi:outer membrane immunogenic protein
MEREMKNVLVAGVSIVALFAAGVAGAADLPSRMAAPPAAGPVGFSWTGLYIGTHTGVAVGRTRSDNLTPFGGFDAGIPLSYDVHPVNIFGGGQIGYNWHMGAFLLGVEGDIGYLGIRDTIRPAPDDLVAVKYGWYGTMTARAGLVYDRLLSYVKGGAAVARITNTASDLDGNGAIDTLDFSEVKRTKWGWTVGTGFELAIAPQWSMKAEYMYMDFGRQNSGNLDGDTFQHRNQVHSYKIGLNYRWGGSAPLVARY